MECMKGGGTLSCEQCSIPMTDILKSTILSQQKRLSPGEEPREICVGCFSNNGNRFANPDNEPPLSARVREEQAHQSSSADKSTIGSRILRSTRKHVGTLPATERKRARFDISKKGRLGKPVGAKLNGETVWECPICGDPCPRTRATARSLDDVVEHMIASGEYETWEQEIGT